MSDNTREKEIEELSEIYLRSELDGIAEDLGINSSDYPNKSTISEAILMMRENGKTSEEESFEEELEEVPLGILEEAKIEVEKVPTKSVNGLINYFDNYRNTEFKEGVNAQYPKWSDQVKENKDFGDALNQSCQELVAKYDAFVDHTFTKCVADFQESVQNQIANNNDFVTKFYG